jgi:hypothetical protein
LSLGVEFITANKSGLGSLYVQADSLKKNGGYFEPLSPIQGYPAVLYSQSDDRADGACTLAVGVSDTLDYSVSVEITHPASRTASCETVEKAADMVITNLKAGS